MKNKYYLREEGNKIFMCCGKAGCPSVESIPDGSIKISDDHGNSVQMKVEEAELIKAAVEKLSSTDEE
jgi:hypothetical protein|tara:strand:- start:804 stop:1007 length:204 start_codon:yes stop_codon:yes gene_type:complete